MPKRQGVIIIFASIYKYFVGVILYFTVSIVKVSG